MICPRCDARWFVNGDGTTTLAPQRDDLHTSSYTMRPTVAPTTEVSDVRRGSFRRAARLALAGGATLALAMGLIGARERIVRVAPRLAGLYDSIGLSVNVRGLAIATLAPRRVEADAMQVAGEIKNVAPRRVVVPRLVYEVRDAQGAPLLTWTESGPARSLGSGHTVSFVSAPHQVPSEARTLLVRFESDEAVPMTRLARRGD